MRTRNHDLASLTRPRAFTVQCVCAAIFALSVAACGPKYPNCEQDEDCKDGEFCVNQLCQQCRTDDHCGEGQQCNGGACEDIVGYCTSDTDCGEGEECVDQRCQSIPEPTAAVEPVTEAGPCEIEHVYFPYDSSNLEGSARDAIERNATCMKERGYSSLQLTGHTDPRGTEEYNLALGDRRAQSVRKYLIGLGVQDASVKASSVGEEMASGTDESSWATDRKVEFKAK